MPSSSEKPRRLSLHCWATAAATAAASVSSLFSSSVRPLVAGTWSMQSLAEHSTRPDVQQPLVVAVVVVVVVLVVALLQWLLLWLLGLLWLQWSELLWWEL